MKRSIEEVYSYTKEEVKQALLEQFGEIDVMPEAKVKVEFNGHTTETIITVTRIFDDH